MSCSEAKIGPGKRPGGNWNGEEGIVPSATSRERLVNERVNHETYYARVFIGLPLIVGAHGVAGVAGAGGAEAT